MIAEKIAELETKISSSTDAKEKVNTINQLAFEIRNSDTPRSISLCKEAQKISTEINYRDGNASALTNEAFCCVQFTDYELALEKLFEALKIFEELKNEKGVAQVHYNLCLVYFRFSDFNSGLDSITKALGYYQKINDITEMARCFFQMGFLYHSLNDNKSAIEYLTQSLNLNREVKNKAGEAAAIMGLGQAYLDIKEYEKSKEYLLESMAIREQIKDWRGYAASLNAYMTLCADTGKNEEAEEISRKGIKLATELGDKMGICRFMLGLGKVYLKQNKTDKAKDAFMESLKIAEKINLRMALAPIYFSLSEIYRSKNNYEKAFAHYQRFHEVKEEMLNIDAAMKAKSIQFVSRIENAQKEAEINRLKNVELKNAYEEIELKNKDITDSINYAKRIQDAILPSQEMVNQYLKNSFIFYHPKDIVAGDFYWMEVIDNIVFIAVADCTGHGVPGAMVSVVCCNALNRSVKEFGLRDTGKILDKLTELVLETFEKGNSDVKDGMDISLLAIHFSAAGKEPVKLEWSGANNPLWYFANKEFKKIKPNKQPIGKYDYSNPFTTNNIEYTKDSIFYLFTDGLPDQFGGPSGKKYMYKRFEENILAIYNLPLKEQKEKLHKAFQGWKGNLEQVDDVTVVGIKF